MLSSACELQKHIDPTWYLKWNEMADNLGSRRKKKHEDLTRCITRERQFSSFTFPSSHPPFLWISVLVATTLLYLLLFCTVHLNMTLVTKSIGTTHGQSLIPFFLQLASSSYHASAPASLTLILTWSLSWNVHAADSIRPSYGVQLHRYTFIAFGSFQQ